jgi:flagellar biosynthesis protein FlhB
VYKGHQVFIYKRAQIFVADLWGAFKGQGLGEFKDVGSITMFADYVVPAVLRHWGILTCSQALVKMLDSLQELPSGSEEEVELRACTITAVERLREILAIRTGKEVCTEILFCTFLSYFCVFFSLNTKILHVCKVIESKLCSDFTCCTYLTLTFVLMTGA